MKPLGMGRIDSKESTENQSKKCTLSLVLKGTD